MRSNTVLLALVLGIIASVAAQNASKSLSAVIWSAHKFSNDLSQELAKENSGKNFISSPFSVHTVLSMAAYGAGGNTAKKMWKSLHLPQNNTIDLQGFKNLSNALHSIKGVTLRVANKVYVAKGFDVKPQFKQLTSDSFGSESVELDINQPAQSAEVINQWVKNITNDKIKEIIKSDQINPDSRMFLLNAVYFKGKWETKFNRKRTQNRIFYVDERTQKNVSTMLTTGMFVCGNLSDIKAQFIELPYKNKQTKMIIIFPNEVRGLRLVEENLKSLSAENLNRLGNLQSIELLLPKFKLESEIDLNKPLAELGMADMLGGSANFSGIANAPLKVSKVIQKATIDVNEEGSEVTAATGVFVHSYSAPRRRRLVVVDKPFYFAIVSGGVTLFAGHVLEPNSVG